MSNYKESGTLQCVVCRSFRYDYDDFLYSHIEDVFFCCSACYDVYKVAPLAYDDGPKKGHVVSGWTNTKHNLDRMAVPSPHNE